MTRIYGKRIIVTLFCLVAVMVFAVLLQPTAVQAASHTDHCVCTQTTTDPNHTCEGNVTWEPFSTATFADGGHYYLDQSKTTNNEDSFEIRETICVRGTAEAVVNWHKEQLEKLSALFNKK